MLTNILIISASVSAAVLILRLFAPLTDRKFRVAWRYYLLLLLAVRLLIPVRFELPNAPIQVPLLHSDFQTNIGAKQSEPPVFAEQETSPAAEQKPIAAAPAPKVIHWNTVFLWIWALGAAVCFLAHIISYITFMHALSKDRKILEKRGRILICTSPMVDSPLLIGYLHPCIMLPQNMLNEAETEQVISHELAHYRRGDLWAKLLLCAAVSMHWFNPVIHYMVRITARDMEYSCDDSVLGKQDSAYRKSYAETMLKMIKSR